MSAIVDGIAQLLAAAGVGAYSTTAALPPDQVPITVDAWPSTAGAAVVLATYAGPEPDSRNGWEYPRLQVKVRDADPLAAQDLDRAVYDELQARAGLLLPGAAWWLQDCHALQSDPQPLGQDDNGRHEYVRNYQLTTERS